MDLISAMRTYRQVVDSASFTAAAQTLGLSKAAVSKQISDLEAHLGAALLHRTTRRLNVTEAGQLYFDRCQRLLDELDTAEAEMRNLQTEPSGRLRISAPGNFGEAVLGPIICELQKRYPKITLQIELSNRFVDLLEEGFDAALRIRTTLPDSSLIARRLCAVDRVAVAAPSYLKKYGVPKHPRDLAEHNCMIYTLSTAPYDWTFNTPSGPHTVRVNGTIQSNNSQLLVEPLRAGSGIALLPAFSVGADIQSGKLKRILDQFPVDRHELYVVYPHNRHLSPKVRVLVDLLADWFADGGPIACPKEAAVKAR
ncbi:MAG TPA: LysR family transcriptional regulator [Terriglobales bacterium]|nr:LysR family transcriptional regulator [Terriglobales bacterium]